MKNSKDSMSISHEVIIHAPVKDVFPLACPVMEYKWINGWKCKLIHCPNGHVELGCVFKEIMSAPILLGNSFGKTTWTAIKYDPVNYIVHYKLENKVSSSLCKLEMSPVKNSSTKLTLEIIYKAKTKKGGKIIKKNGAKKISFLMSMLGTMLKHYCENDKIIENAEIIKLSKSANFFTFSDKIKMIHNRIAMSIMRDNDKKRFLAGKPVSKTSDKNF